MENKLIKRFVIGTFVSLYALVSIISTIHVIDFFELSNPYWLAVTLAIGFEIGAAASLASLVILKKMNKTIVWALFITITAMQMQGNMYYAFINLEDFGSWSELFDLIEEDVIDQKRILAFVSGAILPLIALGFIKSLVDYIKPEDEEWDDEIPEDSRFDDMDMENGAQHYDAYVDRQEPETETDPLFKEEWDEDHAHDMVLNDMLDGMSQTDLDQMFEDELIDPEIKVNPFAKFEVEDTFGNVEVIDPKNTDDAESDTIDTADYQKLKEAADDSLEINPTSVGAIVEKMPTPHLPDEDDLFKQAMREKSEQEMKTFLSKKDGNSQA
jgi:hypothetical protein|tara:strand:- start:1501 stop:2481 length:981 start_codon:yes stop_codon:yes gene_type:complete